MRESALWRVSVIVDSSREPLLVGSSENVREKERVLVRGSGDAVERVRVTKMSSVSVSTIVRVRVGIHVFVHVPVSDAIDFVTRSDTVSANSVTLSLWVSSTVKVAEREAVLHSSLNEADWVRGADADGESVPLVGVSENVTSSLREFVAGVTRSVTVSVWGSVSVLVTGGIRDSVLVLVDSSETDAV